MPLYSWIALAGGSLISGAAVVGLLSLRRATEPILLVLGIGGMVASWYGIITVADAYDRPEVSVAAVLLALGCLAGGYGLASSVLTSLWSRSPRVRLRDAAETTRSTGCVVLFAAFVEPDVYNPSYVAGELTVLEEVGIAETTIGVTPFLYAAQKARYRAAGGRSPSLGQARAVAERLETILDKERFPRVRLVTGIGRDRLAVALARYAGEGFRHAVVLNSSVAESMDWLRAKDDIEAMRPSDHGVGVAYTTPLWASERLGDAVTSRIWPFVQEPGTTGVALVMHGQPNTSEGGTPDFEVAENAFANRIRMLLVERGLPDVNARLCNAEWRQPDVTETVRHLAALGCTRILVCPVCFAFESLSTTLDLAIAVRQARVSPHIYVTTLTAWGEDPAMAEVFAEAVVKTADEMGW